MDVSRKHHVQSGRYEVAYRRLFGGIEHRTWRHACALRESPDRPVGEQPGVRSRVRQQRPQLLAVERHLRRIGSRIIGIGTIEQQELKGTDTQRVWLRRFTAFVSLRMRIEQTEPAMAAAAA